MNQSKINYLLLFPISFPKNALFEVESDIHLAAG